MTANGPPKSNASNDPTRTAFQAGNPPRSPADPSPDTATEERAFLARPPVNGASRPRPRVGRPRLPPPILVATADASLTRMLAFALDQMRLPHRHLESGSLALRELLAMEVGAQPPIVVLDIDLPGVDGHAILERIGVSRPDTFLIVVLSSHADESVQVRSLLAGAIDHLAKPFNIRVLMAKIQRWTTMASHLAGTA